MARPSKRLIAVVSVLAVIVIAGLLLCLVLLRDRGVAFEFFNDMPGTIREVRITYSGGYLKRPRLEPGESIKTWLRPTEYSRSHQFDCALTIQFKRPDGTLFTTQAGPGFDPARYEPNVRYIAFQDGDGHLGLITEGFTDRPRRPFWKTLIDGVRSLF